MKLLKNFLLITVEIEVQNHLQTVIRSGKSEFNLIGLDADEYPHLPQIEEENIFQIPTDLIKSNDSTNCFCSVHLRNTTNLDRCQLEG